MTNKSKNKGYSLIEVMIVAAAIVVLTAMVYSFYRFVFAAEKGLEESTAAAQLTTAVTQSYDSLPNFAGISTQSVVNDKIAPREFNGSGNTLYSPGGYQVVVASETIGGVAGRGFSLTYRNVNESLCTDFVSGVVPLQRYTSIQVGQTQVSTRGTLNEATLASACASAPVDVKLTYERTSTGNIASLEECVVPAPQTRDLDCPTGYSGERQETRTGRCDGPYENAAWNEWTESKNTCAIICVPDASSPQVRNPARQCDVGFSGVIVDRRVSECPSYNGYPVWGEYVEVSNTCAKICVAPNPASTTDTSACQAKYGSSYRGGITTTRRFSCPNYTGDYKEDAPLITEECYRTCQSQLPATNPALRLVADRKSCATLGAYSGDITFDREEKNTYSCANPTANVAPVQTGWSSTGRIFNENTSACVALCKPDTVLERWVSTTGQCQAGFTGGKSWEKRQTRTSTCPAGAATPTTSAWTDTGQTRNMVDNCVMICTVPTPSTETQNQTLNELRQFACPAGQFGPNPGIDEWRQNNQSRSRTAYCPQFTGSYAWGAWGAWTTTSYSAWNRTANHCNNCPGAYRTSQYRWERRNEGCPWGYSGENSVDYLLGQDYTVAYSCPGGSSPYQAYNTDFGGWYDTGSRQNRYNSCSCANRNERQYVDVGSCGSGQRLCEYGGGYQDVTLNCQNSVVWRGGIVVTSYPVCVSGNQECP